MYFLRRSWLAVFAHPVRWGYTLLTLTLLVSGCAAYRNRGPVTEEVTRCRQFARDAVAAMQMERWDEAENLLMQAVEHCPTDADARRHLAEVLWHQGATTDAAVQMEAAVRLEPGDAETLARAGSMLLAIGATDRALERAEEAIGLDATMASAWRLRGEVFLAQGDVDRGLADLHCAMRYAPGDATSLMQLARVANEAGRHARALTAVQHLLAQHSPGEEPPAALVLEGLAYHALGRYSDAVASFTAASQCAPSAEVLYYLANAHHAAGNAAEAAETVQAALATDATHQPSRALLARLAAVESSEANVRR